MKLSLGGLIGLLLVVPLLLTGACADSVPEETEDTPPPTAAPVAPPVGRSVVVISIDTLRSDRLPAYGYGGVETPAIDELRADAVLFERAYSPVPMTLPAHASLLTGLLPPEHGVRDNAGYRLEDTVGPTVPELLQEAGYATGAAVSAYVLRSETGVSRGFDHYDDRLPDATRTLMGDLQRPGQDTVDAALRWIEGLEERRPFFLLAHLYEPHTPRRPPEPYASRYADPYDGEVAWVDTLVGRLLDGLKERGLYDDATVILLSDHGEGLGDHGEDEHGILLYRESLQVPLLVKLPAGAAAGGTVPAPVQLSDVAPTILALAGAETPRGLSGVSLLGLATGEPAPAEFAGRALYAETYQPRLRYGWSPLRSLIQGRHHYLEGALGELYDLEADPAEAQDLIRQDRRTYAELRDRLATVDPRLELPFEEDTETRQALAALGYLGGTTLAAGPLPDPRQQIGSLELIRDGIALVHDRRSAEAIPLLLQATKAIPASIDAWQFLAVAYEETGHPEESLAAYEKAFELSNGAPYLAPPMAGLALRLERWIDAAAYIELAMEESPDDLRLRFEHARALHLAGKLDEALRSAQHLVAAAPRDPNAHHRLAAIRMSRLELPEAEQEFKRALELAPDHPQTLNDLAVLLTMRGREDEAAETLERLVRIQPQNSLARRNLARLRGGF